MFLKVMSVIEFIIGFTLAVLSIIAGRAIAFILGVAFVVLAIYAWRVSDYI